MRLAPVVLAVLVFGCEMAPVAGGSDATDRQASRRMATPSDMGGQEVGAESAETDALTARVQRYVASMPDDSLAGRVARYEGRTLTIPDAMEATPGDQMLRVGEYDAAPVEAQPSPPVVTSVAIEAAPASAVVTAPDRAERLATSVTGESVSKPIETTPAASTVSQEPVAGTPAVADTKPTVVPTTVTSGPKPPPTVVSVRVKDTLGQPGSTGSPRGESNLPLSTVDGAQPAGLRYTIETLREELAKSPNQPRKQLALRLLSVLDGQDDLAKATMPGTNEDMQQVLDALVEVLLAIQPQGEQGLAADGQRTLAAIETLRALARERADLRVSTVALCSAIRSYGNYDVIEPAVFRAGIDSAVGVYCEVENYRSQRTEGDQFKTVLTFRIQMYAADGTIVYQQPPEPVQDVSRKPRNDFFLRKRIRIPATLAMGQYTLKVAITDVQAGKYAEQVVQFKVVEDEDVSDD